MEVTINFLKEGGSFFFKKKAKRKKTEAQCRRAATCTLAGSRTERFAARCSLSFKGIGWQPLGEPDPLPDSADLGGPVHQLTAPRQVQCPPPSATSEPLKDPDFSAGHFRV